LLSLVGIVIAGFAWYCMVQPFLKLRQQFFPQDAFLMDGTRLGNIAMHVAPAFPAFVVGFLFANYCISTLWRGARVGTRMIEPSGFDKAKSASSKMGLVVVVVAILAAGLGATSYFYLTPLVIVQRVSILQAERTYQWSEVTGIETACWYSGGQEQNYFLRMRDGTGIGVLESYPDFLNAYPLMAAALRGHTYTFDHQAVTPKCEASLSSTWKRLLTTPPSSFDGRQY
jgi:hypothetical protein